MHDLEMDTCTGDCLSAPVILSFPVLVLEVWICNQLGLCSLYIWLRTAPENKGLPLIKNRLGCKESSGTIASVVEPCKVFLWVELTLLDKRLPL